MATCAGCSKEVSVDQLMMSGLGEACADCLDSEDSKAKFGGLHSMALSAAVVAGLSLFVHLTHQESLNGQIVEFKDWGAAGFGGLACVLAVFAIIAVLPTRYAKAKNLGIAVLALVVGAYRLAYGLGMLV